MPTPFFPAFRARLAPLGRRVQRLQQQSLLLLEQVFGQFVPAGLLSQADEGPNSRERVYSVRRTFWAFFCQVLNPACPCREVVRQIQARFCLHHRGPVAEGTGGYCQARARLPLDTLQRLRQTVATHTQQLTGTIAASAPIPPSRTLLPPKRLDQLSIRFRARLRLME